MMQATKEVNGDDVSFICGLGLTRDWGVPGERLMRPGLVIVDHVLFEDPAQMAFVEDDHVIMGKASGLRLQAVGRIRTT